MHSNAGEEELSGYQPQGGLAAHLREAITLNRERLPRYARLSGGATRGLSRALIISEHMILPFGLIVDLWAGWFQRRGIPIGRLEFMPMSRAPEFKERFPQGWPRPSLYIPLAGGAIALRLKSAWKSHGFGGLERQAAEEIGVLAPSPHYYAMTRHLLESLRRIAALAPLHERLAKESGVPSTRRLSAWMAWTHLPLFRGSARLDAASAPIQAQGIPFLIQDLPAIPPETEYYRRRFGV